MNSDSYLDWLSIYDEELKATWEKERAPLQKLAMIHLAFQNEMNNLKNSLAQEYTEIKITIKKKDFLDKCKNFVGLAQSERFDDIVDKENKICVPLKERDSNDVRKEDFVIESPDTSDFFQCRSPSPKPIKNTNVTSPVLRKNSFTKPKSKKSNSPQNKLTTKKSKSPENKTPVTIPKDKIFSAGDLKNFRTPTNCDDSNIMDSSIIEDTPELKPAKRTKSTSIQLKKQKTRSKLNQSKQGNTLTQMFFEPKKTKKKIDSNMASMSISEMINLINESSGSDTDAGLDQSDETVDLEVANSVEAVPENLKSFVANYDKIPEKIDCSPKFVFQDVVRGNARKKLKGWSCNECKDYYEALNLPSDELEKKKNQCSRHRHRFKPRDDTYTGFWDLTFGPSPKTQDSEKSLVFNYKKT